MFIGREAEKQKILRMFDSSQLETILVYGRRRVGKSELIKQCLRESTVSSIYYECKQTTEMNNVDSLSTLISEILNLPKLAFSSFEEILKFLFQYAKKEKFILVLDEYSYLKDKIVGIDSILQSFIDEYKDKSQMKLILCGSYVDVMKSIVGAHNPLYGRIFQIIDLKPMDYYDSSLFYPSFSNEDKVRLYSVFGGIPYYNKLVDESKTVKENIIELIASPGARLELEVSMYLKSEIGKIVNANEVFETMATGVSKYQDILSKSHVSSSPTLADVLEKLMKMEVISKEAPMNDEQNKKKSKYIISDHLSMFYYKYIFRYASQMNVMDSEAFYKRYIQADFENQYVPHIFERICKQYLIRQNRKGLLKESFEKIGKYYYDDPINKRKGEFDLVTLDQKGFIFYEAKFRNQPMTSGEIKKEMQQADDTGMKPYCYGFFSKSGYEEKIDSKKIIYYELDDLYKNH